MKIRPQILLAEVGLLAIAGYALFLGLPEVALGAVAIVGTTMDKLVERE